MSKHQSQSGFSAVELLISLFIAVAFVGAGYQLYAVVVKDGGEAELRSKANDIAYDKLRSASAQATNPCTAPAPTTTALPASDLPSATVVTTISCPYAASATSKVSVSVKYGTPQQEVVHALFVKN
jgi:Tfp pilus assembly protein PilV